MKLNRDNLKQIIFSDGVTEEERRKKAEKTPPGF